MTDGELEILSESDRLAHKRRRREMNDLYLLMAREGDAIRRRLGIPVNVSDRDNEVREELLRCVEEQRARNAERMVTTRAEALVNMTDEERAEERDRQAARMATAREEARIGIFHADARLGVTPAPFTLGERNLFVLRVSQVTLAAVMGASYLKNLRNYVLTPLTSNHYY